MKDVIFLAQRMMIFGIPLLIVALAAVYSERSGVINIALEGIMIIGAFTGTLFIYFMQKNGLLSGYPLLIVAMLISTLRGCCLRHFMRLPQLICRQIKRSPVRLLTYLHQRL